ncbi:hypothetical protein [Methyloversatilis sp.]|uniref:hypothetical protein n=1 Tax=Methyloversatilis sp. TaxID=2569862 RepID=UPI0027BA4394|nr:hypothetical protein [Methyloversatilis sp.]
MVSKKSVLVIVTVAAGRAHAGVSSHNYAEGGDGGVSSKLGAAEGFGFLFAAVVLFALMRFTTKSPFFGATFGYLGLMCGAVGLFFTVATFPWTLLLIGAAGVWYWLIPYDRPQADTRRRSVTESQADSARPSGFVKSAPAPEPSNQPNRAAHESSRTEPSPAASSSPLKCPECGDAFAIPNRFDAHGRLKGMAGERICSLCLSRRGKRVFMGNPPSGGI